MLTWLSFEVASATTYRVGILIWMCHGLLPLVVMFIWFRVAEANADGPMSGNEVFHYFIAVYLIGQIIASPSVGLLERDIRSGKISLQLLRPVSPFWEPYFKKMAYLIVCFPMLFLPFILYPVYNLENPIKSFEQTAFVLLSLVLAHFINYNRQYAMGLLSFWTDKALSMGRLWESIHFVASGAYAPLLFYPEMVQKIIFLTPFPYVVGIPANIYIGQYDSYQMAYWVGGQCFWLAFFVIIRKFLWNKGLRHYSADGA